MPPQHPDHPRQTSGPENAPAETGLEIPRETEQIAVSVPDVRSLEPASVGNLGTIGRRRKTPQDAETVWWSAQDSNSVPDVDSNPLKNRRYFGRKLAKLQTETSRTFWANTWQRRLVSMRQSGAKLVSDSVHHLSDNTANTRTWWWCAQSREYRSPAGFPCKQGIYQGISTILTYFRELSSAFNEKFHCLRHRIP